MTDLPSYDDFKQQLDTQFSLADEPRPQSLRLAEVTVPTEGAGQRFFSLYFLGEEEAAVPQGIYRLVHEKLGELAIFLVPVSREGSLVKYEAVFNSLIDG